MILQLSLAERLQQALTSLTSLLDWVAQAERSLGSEQAMSETPKVLQSQAKDHKVSLILTRTAGLSIFSYQNDVQ